jgi:predicted RNA methylase
MNEKLRQITDEILFNSNSKEIEKNCNKLYDLFAEVVEIESLAEIKTETILPQGKAISPDDAARCVIDYNRTTKFLRGIYHAILQLQKNFPDEEIEILYAGCGPFATLAIPLCTQFSSENLKFTLIDIHQISLDSAQKLFQKCGLENFVKEFIKTNACTFQPNEKFHLIISETMQKSLEKEPQVAITLNLLLHLHEKGIFIPQKISVNVCLADLNKEFTSERKHTKLATILELTKDTKKLPKVLVKIPDNNLDVMFVTRIKVFESFELDVYNSGLTYPTILFDLKARYGETKVEFEYKLGENPQFIYEKI